MKNKKPIKKSSVKNVAKNPKKVLAGKARAAKAIRVRGRFTSNQFLDYVSEKAKISGYKNPFQFFLENEISLTKQFENGSQTSTRNSGQIKKDMKKYKGKIILNGREVKKATALKNIQQLVSKLKMETTAVDFYVQYNLTFDGKMKIKIPTAAQIQKLIDTDEDIFDQIEDDFSDAQFSFIISDKKK